MNIKEQSKANKTKKKENIEFNLLINVFQETRKDIMSMNNRL